MQMQSTKPRRRYLLWMAIAAPVAILLIILVLWGHSFSLIPELFKLNKECQEEGYYMAEFEFKMLGFAYLLDKGHYLEAAAGIRALHKQLESRQGLIKVPSFSDKKQEMDFYLNLQNPRTGAFMDDSNPYCTYDGPTGNVLLHLEALAKETGQPLRLKYPLKYLDEINTPDKLRAYLDDVSYVGWIASKLPQTSFHFARDLLNYCEENSVIERHNLYRFSPAWKMALLEWFHENQDPVTGFWGPRSRSSGRLVKMDLNNTASIVKAFVHRRGEDIHSSLPLRYKSRIFDTTLQVMSEPVPADDELDEWHEWSLKMSKGISLLTRRLWKNASREHRDEAERLIGDYLRLVFDKYYIPNEGAFSYYPSSRHATLDGTNSGIGCFEKVGAFSAQKQRYLWGGSENTCTDLGSLDVEALTEKDFDSIKGCKNINSWRFYPAFPAPADYTTNVAGIFYPGTHSVLDVMELVPNVRRWMDATSQSMGNWVSREEISGVLEDIEIEPVAVSHGEVPLEVLNGILKESKTLTVIGFDVLQIPRCSITFKRGKISTKDPEKRTSPDL
jgi:hypothetical protein